MPHGTSRAATTLLTLLAMAGASALSAQSNTAGWPVSTPAQQGLDATRLNALDSAIVAGDYGHVDRLVVVRNGQLVLNRRYAQDYRAISRGRTSPIGCGEGACATPADVHPYNYLHPDWHPYPQGQDVHSLQSVTKSVSSILIGIAIARGEIAGVNAPLLSFLGTYDLSRVDGRLWDATLEDLLTMRTGIEWHETDRPLDETNTTLMLERSDDWVRFTLAQPMDAAPGEKWVYNSGGSHVMSAVVRAATGRTIDDYAREHLFGPLGIDAFHWKKEPAGLPDTEGGLYLEALDLAKIGQLYLDGGTWNGRRVVPAEWVRASVARHVDRANAAGFGYGYQWWRLDRNGVEVWAGLGFGGQFLLVLPRERIVGVANSWNLFGPVQRNLLNDFLDSLIASARPARPDGHLLVFTKSAGYEHDVVRRSGGQPSVVEQSLQRLAARMGWQITVTKDGGVFDRPLDEYNAVLFFTTGDLTTAGTDGQPPMSAPGKNALLAAVAAGLGFVGVHSASDTFHGQAGKVDPYIAMLGGEFESHGRPQSATVRVVDRPFSGVPAGSSLERHGEWYAFRNLRDDVAPVLLLETRGMQGGEYARPPYPVTWTRTHGRGRVVYTALGHFADEWSDGALLNLIEGALRFVAPAGR